MAAFAMPSLGQALVASPFLSASAVVAGALLLHRVVSSPATAAWLRIPGRSLAITLRLRNSSEPFDQRATEAALQAAFDGLPGARRLDTGRLRLLGADVREFGEEREVTLQIARPGLPLGLHLRGWIDDTFGRACDRLAEGTRPMPAPVPVVVPQSL